LLRIVIEFSSIVLSKFLISIGRALVLMESQIFFHAFVIAVFHVFAFAYCSEDILAVAPFANTDGQNLTLFEFEGKIMSLRWPEFDHEARLLVQCQLIEAQS